MIKLHNVGKSFAMTKERIVALKNISFNLEQGEFVAILGPSGSGKSTLLSMIGCLDTVDDGEYLFRGQAMTHADDETLARIRNQHIGFVFQSFNLIPRLSAVRNVEIPMIYSGVSRSTRYQRAVSTLTAVGLGERLEHTPAQLSGGQQQRVALARALVNNPDLIIADEPTASLDRSTAQLMMQALQGLNAKGKSIILVTHDIQLANFAKRHILLRDGQLVDDYLNV